MLPASNKKVEMGGKKITDEQGNVFSFGIIAQNNSISSCLGAQQGGTNTRAPSVSNFLSSVTTYNGETITFHYSLEEYSYRKADLKIKRIPMPLDPAACLLTAMPEDVTCENYYLAKDRRLEYIESSSGEMVKLHYATRQDLTGATRIEKIEVFVKMGGVYHLRKRFDLVHAYFGQGNAVNLRLRLDKVKVFDGAANLLNSYDFQYYEGDILNRLESNYDFIFINSYNVIAKHRVSVAGALKRITYPTGGETHFYYEPRTDIGQLVIRKIVDYEQASGFSQERSFSYEFPNFSSRSMVFTSAEIMNRIATTTSGNTNLQNYCDDMYGTCAWVLSCTRMFFQSEPISGDTLFQAMDADFFGVVTEMVGYKGRFGKTIYHYSVPITDASSPGEAKLFRKEVFEKATSGDFVLKVRESNQYFMPPLTFDPMQVHPLEKHFQFLRVRKIRDQMSTTIVNNTDHSYVVTFCAQYEQTPGIVRSAPIYLSSTHHEEFENGQAKQTLLHYFYDDLLNLGPTRIETIGSDGRPVVKHTAYPTSDIPADVFLSADEHAALTHLGILNVLAQPFFEKVVIGGQEVQRSLSRYEKVGDRVFTKSVEVHPRGGAQKKTTELSVYNELGMPRQIASDGKVAAFIYESRYHHPIAVVQNAAHHQVAYTSFEPDEEPTLDLGPQPVGIDEGGLTGAKYYRLDKGSLVKNLPDGDYIVSCWMRGGSVRFNNQTPPVLKTVNAWRYVEQKITGTTQVEVAGDALIDELRIYPVMARMSTQTYQPGVGMTSACDQNSTIVYYEYDAAARLIAVRDEHRNILKKHEYHYDQQKPLWQRTAMAARCKPCPENPNFPSLLEEVEEQDQNPASATYGLKRWVETGPTQACSLNARLQYTGVTRCQTIQDVFHTATTPTGWREKERKDMNPCSPTFQQSIWERDVLDLAACPPTRVFVKVRFENVVVTSQEMTADMVFDFFADYHGTQPLAVTNLPLTLQQTFFNQAGTYTTTQTLVANGGTFTLFNLPIALFDPVTHQYEPTLLPGNGYLIVIE